MFTPREIRDTEFDRVSRGYNIEDVDAFLRQVADQMEKLIAERDEAVNQLQPLANQVEQYRSDENAIRSALISAEKMRESIINETNQQRDILVRDAEQKSQRMIDDARERVRKEAEILDEMKDQVTKFKNEILSLYESHLKLIASMPDYVMPEYDENGDVIEEGVEAVADEDLAEIIDDEVAEIEADEVEEPAVDTAEESVAAIEPVAEELPAIDFSVVPAEEDDIPEFSVDNFTIESTIRFDNVQDNKPYDGFAPREKDAVTAANEKFGNLDFGDGFSFGNK